MARYQIVQTKQAMCLLQAVNMYTQFDIIEREPWWQNIELSKQSRQCVCCKVAQTSLSVKSEHLRQSDESATQTTDKDVWATYSGIPSLL